MRKTKLELVFPCATYVLSLDSKKRNPNECLLLKIHYKYLLLFSIFLMHHIWVEAQDTSLSSILQSKQGCVQLSYYKARYGKLRPRDFYLPAIAIGYGILAQQNNIFHQFDLDTRNGVVPVDRSKTTHIDNYLQFAPGIITLGLTATGVKGNQNLRDAAITYAITNIILNATVIPVKHYAHRQRPDSSDFSSFPSGHTTEAFANAEFMRMQYGKKYPLLAIAGYLMAGTTGYLRMYNNKHWFSDVVAGAAIGFCSARLAGWVYTRLQPKIFPPNHKTKGKITSLTPVF